MAPTPNSATRIDQKNLATAKAELLPCDFCPGQGLNVCKALERGRLRELLSMGMRHKWKKGDHLFTAGERVKSVFKISKGIAALSLLLPDGRRQIIGFPMVGEICGMMETDGRYVLTARAVTEVEGCSFDSDRLNAFVERHADVAHEQRQSLQRDLAFVTQRALVLGRLLAHEKLAHFLLEFSDACARHGMETQPLMLPMTRVDIADYLGLTVETVSRTFAELRAGNLVRTLDHAVLILDRRRLEETAAASIDKSRGLSVSPRPSLGRQAELAPRLAASSIRPASR